MGSEDEPNDGALGSMPTTNAATYAATHSRWVTGVDRFPSAVTRGGGSSAAFCGALTVIVV